MPKNVVVDAGPIVAWLRADDPQHGWAAEQIGRLPPPLISCEAALSEASHLVWCGGGDPAWVISLVVKGVIRVGISVEEQTAQLQTLMKKYRDVPMSLADACLVRMTELFNDAAVMTFDSDFRIYRRSGRALVPLIAPEGI